MYFFVILTFNFYDKWSSFFCDKHNKHPVINSISYTIALYFILIRCPYLLEPLIPIHFTVVVTFFLIAPLFFGFIIKKAAYLFPDIWRF